MKHAIVSGVRIATELRVTVLVPFSRESPTSLVDFSVTRLLTSIEPLIAAQQFSPVSATMDTLPPVTYDELLKIIMASTCTSLTDSENRNGCRSNERMRDNMLLSERESKGDTHHWDHSCRHLQTPVALQCCSTLHRPALPHPLAPAQPVELACLRSRPKQGNHRWQTLARYGAITDVFSVHNARLAYFDGVFYPTSQSRSS